jgi:hypothetical protein
MDRRPAVGILRDRFRRALAAIAAVIACLSSTTAWANSQFVISDGPPGSFFVVGFAGPITQDQNNDLGSLFPLGRWKVAGTLKETATPNQIQFQGATVQHQVVPDGTANGTPNVNPNSLLLTNGDISFKLPGFAGGGDVTVLPRSSSVAHGNEVDAVMSRLVVNVDFNGTHVNFYGYGATGGHYKAKPTFRSAVLGTGAAVGTAIAALDPSDSGRFDLGIFLINVSSSQILSAEMGSGTVANPQGTLFQLSPGSFTDVSGQGTVLAMPGSTLTDSTDFIGGNTFIQVVTTQGTLAAQLVNTETSPAFPTPAMTPWATAVLGAALAGLLGRAVARQRLAS